MLLVVRVRAGTLSLVSLLLLACAGHPPAPAAPSVVSFDTATAQMAAALLAQTVALPARDKALPRRIAVDPLIEAGSGQQTAATTLLQKRVTDQLSLRPAEVEIIPFEAMNLEKTDYLLIGSVTGAANPATDVLQLDVALLDIRRGTVVAHLAALAHGAGVDRTPLPYFRDSPIQVRDAAVDGYVRSAATAAGQAANPLYLEHLNEATLVDEATRFYNAGRYEEGLTRYRAAARLPSGQQLRVYNGLYLSYVKLARAAEAEQAFGDVVAAGIRYKELSLKLLFAPGRTEFWTDQRVSGPYAMWLRQIARQSEAAKSCLLIIGHTSATGTAELNNNLSLQRANVVRQRIVREVGDLALHVKAAGKGSEQNIVGSGTDDAVDALDRRVEFKVTPCG